VAERIVLVTGATGQQGGAVAAALKGAGFAVRALVRDPAKPSAEALKRAGAELATGDLGDAASVARALKGTYGVFTYGVYRAEAAHDAGGGERISGEVEQGRLMADLAAEAKVAHFVYGSVGNANRGTGVPHFDSKGEVEKHVTARGLPATIVRPVFFMQNWERLRARILEGTLAQPLSPTTLHKQIAVQDIGAFVARVFADPARWIGRAADIAGVALTMEETVATMSRVIGRPVRYVQMSWEECEKRLGRPSTLMFRFFENGGFVADPAILKAEVPHPHTLDDYLREAGWGKTT
jgi:uncharacterized protein YbjT (DUF2867 family)